MILWRNIDNYPKIVVFIGSTSFDHVINVIADVNRMHYFVVAKYLIGENVSGQFFTVLRCSVMC